MIARIWRGITLAEKADAYIDYLNETGLKDYANTPGNLGVSADLADSYLKALDAELLGIAGG